MLRVQNTITHAFVAALLAVRCSALAVQQDGDPVERQDAPDGDPVERQDAPEEARAPVDPMSLQRDRVIRSGTLSDMEDSAPVDPMSLQRDRVLQNGTLSDMARLQVEADATAALEARLRLQVADCLKSEDTGKAGHTGSTNPQIFNRPWSRDMRYLQDSDKWGMLPPYRQAQPGQKVKVAFLMFANDRIDNENVWVYWMDQAVRSEMDFSIFIHAYGLPPRGNASWLSHHFTPYLVQEQARTHWCQMWEAQMLLIRKALEDVRHTHLMMVSSDSVPVKPMSFIYSQLSQKPNSRFCADDYWRTPWPRAETWSVLRRGDAEFFSQNKEFAARHLKRDCEEELAWYFPLTVRWGNHGGQAAVDRECIMFTNWKDGEKACKEVWAENADRCNCPKLRASERTPAGFKHPVIYHKVKEAAFEELVRSPFWFARKIADGAVRDDLKDMLHENFTQKGSRKHKRRFFFR